MKDNKKNSAARRFLLVSRDLNKPDFWEHLPVIAGAADQHRCSVLVYALSTVCDHGGKRRLTRERVFGKSQHLQHVMLETGNVRRESNIRTEWWQRANPEPHRFIRRFATSTEPRAKREMLMAELTKRQRADTMLLVCGETNIVRTSRSQPREIVDEHKFLAHLDTQKPRYIINPWHTFAFRYEVNLKRKALSQNNRVVISLWNKNQTFHHEAKNPWVVFANNEPASHLVQPVPNPIPSRGDIMASVLEI